MILYSKSCELFIDLEGFLSALISNCKMSHREWTIYQSCESFLLCLILLHCLTLYTPQLVSETWQRVSVGGFSGSCDAFLEVSTFQQLVWSRRWLLCGFIFRLSAGGCQGNIFNKCSANYWPTPPQTLHPAPAAGSDSGAGPHTPPPRGRTGKVRRLWVGMCSHVSRRYGNP